MDSRAQSTVQPGALLAGLDDLVTVHARDGVVVFASAASGSLLGRTAEELVGSAPWLLVHVEDRPALRARLRALRERPGEVDRFGFRLRHADGTYRSVEASVRNGLDDPELSGFLVSTRDVTGRVRADQWVRRSESRLRRLVAAAPTGLVVVDGDNLVRFANPAALAVTGLASLDELLGRPVAEVVVPADRARCSEALRQAIQTRVAPGTDEYRLLRPDAVDMVVSSAPLPYDWEGAPAALLVLQDVTSLRQSEDERRLAADGLRRILEATAEGIIGLDAHGHVSFINPAAAQGLGLQAEAVLGQPAHPIYHHSREDGTPYPEQDCPCLKAARTGRSAVVEGEVFWRSDGTSFPVEYRATPLREGEASGAVLTFHDVSERARARARLARLAVFQSAVLDALPSLTAVVDAAGRIVAVNAAWVRHGELHGADPARCGPGTDVLAVCDAATGPASTAAHAVGLGLRRLLAGRIEQYQRDVVSPLPTGEVRHYSLMIVPLRGADGGAVLSYTDITVRKSNEVDTAHRATHDLLTGLPNRTLLMERLDHALAARGAPSVGLLFLDLDSFKMVNDGYGHEAGDAVLQEVARRLCEHVRPADTVARLAGDEFVVLCEDLVRPTEAQLLAERLLAALAEPFSYGDTVLRLGASIGVALASETVSGSSELLRAADQAMFDAKAAGRHRFTVYDAGVHDRHHVRLEQGLALRRLVEHDELVVHYQPIVDLGSGRIDAVEALLRWHGNVGLPDTTTAVGLAEEVGLIGRIGEFVLQAATREAMGFRRPDGSVLALGVNLAPQQLQPSLVQHIESAAEQTGFPLSCLTLELTERTIMHDPPAAVSVLQALRKRGVRVALDDFGVGYSSLAALAHLPIDVLKIDAQFVHALTRPQSDARIITAVIELARVLGLGIVAEGVELEEQRERLLELGCTRGQGFLFSRARPASAIRALLVR